MGQGNRSCEGEWDDNAHLSIMQCMSITYSFFRLESYEMAKFEAATDEFLDGLHQMFVKENYM